MCRWVTVWQLWQPSDAAQSQGKQTARRSDTRLLVSLNTEPEPHAAAHHQTDSEPAQHTHRTRQCTVRVLEHRLCVDSVDLRPGRWCSLSAWASWHQWQTEGACTHLWSYRAAELVRCPENTHTDVMSVWTCGNTPENIKIYSLYSL